MGLFSNSKIEGHELQECLELIEGQTRIMAFQTRESNLYDSTIAKYMNIRLDNNPQAAKEAYKASHRLLQCTDEVLRLHSTFKPTTEAAITLYNAWHRIFVTHHEWALSATVMIEAMTTGKQADLLSFQKALDECKITDRQWLKDYQDFFKRLDKESREQLKAVVDRVASERSFEYWVPEK